MRLRIFLVGVVFLSATFAFSYQEVKELSLSAEGIKKLEIRCGAGSLEVLGKEDLEEIQVIAEIVFKGVSEERAKKFIRERIKLSIKKTGEKAILVSKFKQFRPILFSFKERVINMTVNVPKNMPLQIDDGSGWLRIENITGNVDIDDGSGSMEILNVTGELHLEDSSGDVRVEKIKGNMEIDDSSGDLKVKNISGDVKIDDGSGEIDMVGIFGNVAIDDGSGTIYVRDVQGEVVVSDGSGSINIDGVERDVTIKSDGSGSVNIKNVKGKIAK
jgi:DUF4097 and DUF4098 domain-containing protein YvlB